MTLRNVGRTLAKLFGVGRSTRRRVRTFAVIGPSCEGWPAWVPHTAHVMHVAGCVPDAYEVWLISTKLSMLKLRSKLTELEPTASFTILRVTRGLTNDRNVVEWLSKRCPSYVRGR